MTREELKNAVYRGLIKKDEDRNKLLATPQAKGITEQELKDAEALIQKIFWRLATAYEEVAPGRNIRNDREHATTVGAIQLVTAFMLYDCMMDYEKLMKKDPTDMLRAFDYQNSLLEMALLDLAKSLKGKDNVKSANA